jgi:hypothetical protein
MKIATGEVEDDGNTELGMWIVPNAAAARVGAVSPSAMMSYRTDRRQHHRLAEKCRIALSADRRSLRLLSRNSKSARSAAAFHSFHINAAKHDKSPIGCISCDV